MEDFKAHNQEWLREMLELNEEWLRQLNYPEWDDEPGTEAITKSTCDSYDHLATIVAEECDFPLMGAQVYPRDDNSIDVIWYASVHCATRDKLDFYISTVTCRGDGYSVVARLPDFKWEEDIERIGPVKDILADTLRKIHEVEAGKSL